MEKAPAVQFYFKDWLSDINTRLMTRDERGGYIDLMGHEWLETGLPLDDESLAKLGGFTLKEWNSGSGEKIKKCFKKKGKKLIHPRLEKERKKQAEWRLKSSIGGKKSASVRKENKKEPTTLAPPLREKGNQSPTLLSSSSSSSSLALKDFKDIDEKFNLFWKDYPRKQGKEKAKKKFRKDITDDTQYQLLLTALSNYKREIEVHKTESKFIAHGSSFMNKWQDWIEWEEPKERGSSRDDKYIEAGLIEPN